MRSYKGMAKFITSVSSSELGIILPSALPSPVPLDGLWDRPRSTGEESEVAVVAGSVNVTITTQPELERGRYKVKILWIRAVGI